MKLLFFLSLIIINTIVFGQNNSGVFNGSFDSYNQLYRKDTKIGAILPQDKVGSNNYLKLDYKQKKISGGVQFEAYLPSLQGFPFIANGNKIANKYFKYTTTNFSMQVGDFYEQFGSGLVFRAWESRQIGINNALEGANIQVAPFPFLSIKAIYGRQRKNFEYANSNIRAVDAEIDLSKMNTSGNLRTVIGFSFVSRYQEYTGPVQSFPATVNATSTRLEFGGATSSVSLELVNKKSDPHEANNFDKKNGKAFLANLSFNQNNLGATATFRSLKNMSYRSEREAVGSVGFMNFVPALTKQHDYLITNIYVYNAQRKGEIGGQTDWFYYAPKGSVLGGKYGSNFSLNFASYSGLKNENNILSFSNNKYFHDLNLEWKKKWNEKLSIILLYQNVFYNRLIIEGEPLPDVKSNAFVINTVYKYAKKKTFRFELQHLSTKQDKGNWAAVLTEFSFAPKFTFYLSDLYNYGLTDIHYPTLGGSYTKSGTRFGLSYGRQRAGLFCVGGVCRFVPASSGFTATLATTFHK